MKEAIFPGDKVRGVCKVPQTYPLLLWPPVLSIDQTSPPPSHPSGRGSKGPNTTPWVQSFPEGKGRQSLSISLGICPSRAMSKTGLGYKRHEAGTPGRVCRILVLRPQNVLLLATSTLIWQTQFLDGTLCFSLGWLCKVPWVRRERLVPMPDGRA